MWYGCAVSPGLFNPEHSTGTSQNSGPAGVGHNTTIDMPRTNTKADVALQEMVEGAKDEETFTLQQIADKTGLSAERVRQIEAAAIKKMRKQLEAFCRKEGINP